MAQPNHGSHARSRSRELYNLHNSCNLDDVARNPGNFTRPHETAPWDKLRVYAELMDAHKSSPSLLGVVFTGPANLNHISTIFHADGDPFDPWGASITIDGVWMLSLIAFPVDALEQFVMHGHCPRLMLVRSMCPNGTIATTSVIATNGPDRLPAAFSGEQNKACDTVSAVKRACAYSDRWVRWTPATILLRPAQTTAMHVAAVYNVDKNPTAVRPDTMGYPAAVSLYQVAVALTNDPQHVARLLHPTKGSSRPHETRCAVGFVNTAASMIRGMSLATVCSLVASPATRFALPGDLTSPIGVPLYMMLCVRMAYMNKQIRGLSVVMDKLIGTYPPPYIHALARMMNLLQSKVPSLNSIVHFAMDALVINQLLSPGALNSGDDRPSLIPNIAMCIRSGYMLAYELFGSKSEGWVDSDSARGCCHDPLGFDRISSRCDAAAASIRLLCMVETYLRSAKVAVKGVASAIGVLNTISGDREGSRATSVCTKQDYQVYRPFVARHVPNATAVEIQRLFDQECDAFAWTNSEREARTMVQCELMEGVQSVSRGIDAGAVAGEDAVHEWLHTGASMYHGSCAVLVISECTGMGTCACANASCPNAVQPMSIGLYPVDGRRCSLCGCFVCNTCVRVGLRQCSVTESMQVECDRCVHARMDLLARRSGRPIVGGSTSPVCVAHRPAIVDTPFDDETPTVAHNVRVACSPMSEGASAVQRQRVDELTALSRGVEDDSDIFTMDPCSPQRTLTRLQRASEEGGNSEHVMCL